jgi:TfoX/Sxy family transcriptional regulator of competence genes
MPAMPKTAEEAKAAFRELVAPGPGVLIRPMFGSLAVFVNGNMGGGLFGDQIFVRLSPAARERLVAAGGGEFAPMAGRPMKDYATIPGGWRGDAETAADWLRRAVEWTAALPPKEAKAKKK